MYTDLTQLIRVPLVILLTLCNIPRGSMIWVHLLGWGVIFQTFPYVLMTNQPPSKKTSVRGGRQISVAIFSYPSIGLSLSLCSTKCPDSLYLRTLQLREALPYSQSGLRRSRYQLMIGCETQSRIGSGFQQISEFLIFLLETGLSLLVCIMLKVEFSNTIPYIDTFMPTITYVMSKGTAVIISLLNKIQTLNKFQVQSFQLQISNNIQITLQIIIFTAFIFIWLVFCLQNQSKCPRGQFFLFFHLFSIHYQRQFFILFYYCLQIQFLRSCQCCLAHLS